MPSTYLLGVSNTRIGAIMERAFEAVAPQARAGFWNCNKVKLQTDAVHASLIGAMQTKLVDYTSFVKFRKSAAIFTNLWERTFQNLYLQFSDEFTYQLRSCQMKTI